jgi:hypothetical protein
VKFDREIVLELARCHARAAFRELVRQLETGAQIEKPATGGTAAGFVLSINPETQRGKYNRTQTASASDTREI